jgi:hypothetical protein
MITKLHFCKALSQDTIGHYWGGNIFTQCRLRAQVLSQSDSDTDIGAFGVLYYLILSRS